MAVKKTPKPTHTDWSGHDWNEVLEMLHQLEAEGLKPVRSGIMEDGPVRTNPDGSPVLEGIHSLVHACDIDRTITFKNGGQMHHSGMGEFIQWIQQGFYVFGGPTTRSVTAVKNECSQCGRSMAGPGIKGVCVHCKQETRREQSAERSKQYRQRTGITKTPATKKCDHCREVFVPKRSTAKFCSTKCRVAAHRSC